jgi:hypothetical protein
MKLNSSKTRVIAFTKKTDVLHYIYKLLDSPITHRDTIKDLWVKLNSKLYFHVHVDYAVSQSTRMLGLILNIVYSFSTLES